MIRSFLAAVLIAFVAGAAVAQQQFKVGDRVTINATGEPGTVLAATPNANGGFYLKVHLDRYGPYPVGPIYDTSVVPITNNSVGQHLQPAPLPPIAPTLVAPQGPIQA